jgi:hypothetical protein
MDTLPPLVLETHLEGDVRMLHDALSDMAARALPVSSAILAAAMMTFRDDTARQHHLLAAWV